MKIYKIAVFAIFLWPLCAAAEDVSGTQSYFGTVESLASGFYGHTGIQLAPGTTCRGRSEVLLLVNHPRYNEIFALLMTAKTSNSKVKFYQLRMQQEAFGYCTIGEAAIGNFTAWPQ